MITTYTYIEAYEITSIAERRKNPNAVARLLLPALFKP